MFLIDVVRYCRSVGVNIDVEAETEQSKGGTKAS